MHQQSGWTVTPSRLIGAPTSTIPTIFMPDALPDIPPNFSWLGTCTKYAGLHTQWLGSQWLGFKGNKSSKTVNLAEDVAAMGGPRFFCRGGGKI